LLTRLRRRSVSLDVSGCQAISYVWCVRVRLLACGGACHADALARAHYLRIGR
jgi:hypothetical protein